MRAQRNRCFPTKAVIIWRQLDDQGHVRLVEGYLQEAGNFENVRGLDRSPRYLFSDSLGRRSVTCQVSLGEAQPRREGGYGKCEA